MTCPTMNKTKLRHDLERDEGRVDAIYIDTLGHKTFGIGHLVLETDPEYNWPEGTEVDSDRVEECFDDDVAEAEMECAALYGSEWWGFSGELKAILVNMMFNLGRTRLSKFKKMNAAIAREDWEEAGKEGRDSRWYKQVGNRTERLMLRMEYM
tara:strand:+ start:147 stop:605 length:459 start_codon:yes stop_codon:yes gene_type:complete